MERARDRSWIEFGSQILNTIWRFYSAADEAALLTEREGLVSMFTRLEAELSDGPFFNGGKFNLVDAVFAPVFRYFDAFDQLGVPDMLAGLPRVAAWRDALSARNSVRDAVAPDFSERLISSLRSRNGALSKQRAAA